MEGQVVDRAVTPTIIIVNGSATGCAVGCSAHRLIGRVVSGAVISPSPRLAKHGYVLRAFGRTISQAADRAISYKDSWAVDGATGYTVDGYVLLNIDGAVSFTINRAVNHTDRCAVSGATV